MTNGKFVTLIGSWPRDDVHRSLGRVLVGDAHDVELQPLLEPFHRELRRGADQPGGVAQLARVGLRVRGQLLDRFERRRGVRGDDVGRHADARDRREIAMLVGHVRQHGRGDRVRGDVAMEQGVAVGRRLRDERRADHAGSPGPVVDDDLLAPQARQAIGEQPPDDVVSSAGGERDDVADRLDGKILCPRGGSAHPGRSRNREQHSPACFDDTAHSGLLRNGAATTRSRVRLGFPRSIAPNPGQDKWASPFP